MRDNKLSRRYLLELVPFPIAGSYPYKDIENNFDGTYSGTLDMDNIKHSATNQSHHRKNSKHHYCIVIHI